MNTPKRLLPAFLLWLVLFISCEVNEPSDVSSFSFEEITISELQDGYQTGEYTISEVVQKYLDRIEEIDKQGPTLNAMIALNPEAIKIAVALDKEWQEGNIRGPLHGIPVILKDNIDQQGFPTTAGARAMAESYPLTDAWVTSKLKEAGAVIIGKANLSEFANFHSSYSSSGWSGLGGQTRNPYDIERNPCGSSAGSGVAVAANYCLVAIGTETNGSIVCPANNNGIVGIKPTVGLISRSGIIPISFTQDTPGPMARTVWDAAICLGALTGIDSTDSKTSLSKGNSFTDYTVFLNAGGLAGKRIGVYSAPLGRHYRVKVLFKKAREYMVSQGAELVEVDHIMNRSVNGSSFEVMLYEFKDGLNKYFESLGPDAPVKSLEELIELTFADSVEMAWFDHKIFKDALEKGSLEDEEYLKALEAIIKGAREEGMDRVMDELDLDAIIAPTGGPAWKTDLVNGDNFDISSSSPAAIAGYPNVTVPMGFVKGLPVNISFFGRAWSEPVLLEIAYAYEQGTMHRKAPGL